MISVSSTLPLQKMKIFGHRGSSVLFPENTRRSVKEALRTVDGSEFDVQRTKDGCLVILHDDDLKRTALRWSEDTGLSEVDYNALVSTPVCALSYDELKGIKVGRPHKPHSASDATTPVLGGDSSDAGEVLMTLPEALAMLTVDHPTKCFLVEVKGGDSASVPLVVRDVVASGATPEQVILIGFSLPTMVEVKQALPAFRVVHIAHQADEADALAVADAAASAGLDGVDLCADPSSVTGPVADRCRDLGLALVVWVYKKLPGCDTAANWGLLRDRGVDIFTSDLPEPTIPWFEAHSNSKQT